MPSSSSAGINEDLSTLEVVLQTDAAIASLSSLLAQCDKLKLSEASKALLLYGSKLDEITLFWPQSDLLERLRLGNAPGAAPAPQLPTASLLRLVERQEHLTAIHCHDAEGMLAPLFSSLPPGHLQHLETLCLSEQMCFAITVASLSALAGAIARGVLPLLKKLLVKRRVEKGGIRVLMEAFRGGACPHLDTLMLPYQDAFTVYDEKKKSGHSQWPSTSDEKRQEEEMNLLTTIEVLEERRRLGHCAGLKRLDGFMRNGGHDDTRVRLLRLLLPSLETLPDVRWWAEDEAIILKEMGAPLVKRFCIERWTPFVFVDCLASMASLEVLSLGVNQRDGHLMDSLLSVLERHKGNFLPKLEELHLGEISFGVAALRAGRFFEVICEVAAFQSVRKLRIGEMERDSCRGRSTSAICSFSVALAQGAFNGLNELHLFNIWIGGPDFPEFCRGLESNSCAATLTVLSLKKTDLSAENVQALAALIARKSLPSLRELDLRENKNVGSNGVAPLMESFGTAATALEKLDLRCVGMGNYSVKMFVSALQNGALRTLVELNLGGNERIDDTAAVEHLSVAIQAGHLPKLRKLELYGTRIRGEGVKSLAAAILIGGFELRYLSLAAWGTKEEFDTLREMLLKELIVKRGLRMSVY